MMDESIVFLFYEARPLWTLPTDVSRQNSKLRTDFVKDTKIQFVAVRGEVKTARYSLNQNENWSKTF